MSVGIKKDDLVVVIAGKNKSERGRVLRVIPEKNAVIVEGLNVVKRHTKPTPKSPRGGIFDKSMPINLSNVMLIDPKTDKPTRFKVETNAEGKKVRIAKSGAVIEG